MQREEALSVEDNAISFDLRVFPNPTTDILNISVRGLATDFTANIYSVTGQIVRSQRFSGETNSIEVSNFSNGIYLLEIVNTQNNSRSITRFVKN